MFIQDAIIDLLTREPNLTAVQISSKLDKNPRSVKVVLHRMNKREKLVRVKTPREQKTKSGPQNIYTYIVKLS